MDTNDVLQEALAHAAALRQLPGEPSPQARRYLALADELSRLHSWNGLMSLLDEHWPESLVQTAPDSDRRDHGARIVSLIRWVDRLRKIEKNVLELGEPFREENNVEEWDDANSVLFVIAERLVIADGIESLRPLAARLAAQAAKGGG